MLSDFHTETEDESPREVSKELVALHNELMTGNSTTIERLRQALPAAWTNSMRQTVSQASDFGHCFFANPILTGPKKTDSRGQTGQESSVNLVQIFVAGIHP